MINPVEYIKKPKKLKKILSKKVFFFIHPPFEINLFFLQQKNFYE